MHSKIQFGTSKSFLLSSHLSQKKVLRISSEFQSEEFKIQSDPLAREDNSFLLPRHSGTIYHVLIFVSNALIDFQWWTTPFFSCCFH